MGYKLRKEESQDLIYNIDYQVQPNEDYFEFFEGANWTHVCSSDHIHIFSAPEGTTPIYSDKESSLEKYTKVKNQMFKGVFGVITFATLFYFMIFLSGIGRLPEIIGSISSVLYGISILSLFCLTMMIISYKIKISKLRSGDKPVKINSFVWILIMAFFGFFVGYALIFSIDLLN